MAQSANVVWFALGAGAFLCRVELFRSLRAAGALFVGWICSVRFGLRCASIVTGERDRVGGARRRAPNTPGSPCHPRRFAVPSAYRVRLRVGRDATSMWLTPSSRIPAACPGLPRTPRRGRWGPTPPRYFQVINGKNKIIAMSMKNNQGNKSPFVKRKP